MLKGSDLLPWFGLNAQGLHFSSMGNTGPRNQGVCLGERIQEAVQRLVQAINAATEGQF